MNAPAAIKGCFSDFKIIRGRKVCQLVIEVPIEEADAALAAMGGVPSADSERWVAVARLNLAAAKPDGAAQGGKDARPFHTLPLAQQAALKCGDPSFQRFMKATTSNEAAIRVRQECGVQSRADIETDEEAKTRWFAILKDFDQWQRGFR